MKIATFMNILIIELIWSLANITHNYKTTDTNWQQDLQLRTITIQYEKHMIVEMFGST